MTTSNQTIINLVRKLDTLTEMQMKDALERVIADNPEYAFDLLNAKKRYDVYLGRYDNKIKAVKAYRDYTHCGLAEAKNFVEGDVVHKGGVSYRIVNGVRMDVAETVRDLFQKCQCDIHILPEGDYYASDPHELYKAKNY